MSAPIKKESARAQEQDAAAAKRIKEQLDECMKQSKLKGRTFEKPVSWLLGRQLIASLKSTLLYTAFGTKIDARDWMDAKVFPPVKNSPDAREGNNSNDDPAESLRKAIGRAWNGMYQRDPANAVDFTKGDGEFWFDYISDTGDGMTATYSIAYLCLSDLWIRDPKNKMPAVEQTEEQKRRQELPDELLVRMQTKKTDDVTGLKLPRGDFLLVGGDTSYHMADYASLHLRFQQPFEWAYNDLREDLALDSFDDLDPAEKEAEIKRFRPIFGIPGNHDYYDMLDGFRRQFREPTSSRTETKSYANTSQASQLRIRGFRRYQETSYIALRLPFDWLLWGLDTEVGKIDERQRDFFKGLKQGPNKDQNPKRLIVCTSAPTTVFGKFADKDDEKSAKAFFQLGLPRPFLRSENEDVSADEAANEEPPKEEKKLADDDIRLDLAGDVHQYARYWGPKATKAPARHGSTRVPLERDNYASVMSGLGGAFHHPSTTYVDEIHEQALYPDEDESRKHVAEEIFNPWRVMKGGGVWFVGGLVALILAFAAIADRSSRPAIHNFMPFIALGITPPERYESTVESSSEAKRQQHVIQHTVLTNALRKVGITGEWEPKLSSDPDCQTEQERAKPLFLWGKCRTEWPAEYAVGFWLLILTIPVMGLAIARTRAHYREWNERAEAKLKAGVQKKPFNNDDHVKRVNRAIRGYTLWVTLQALVGILLVMAYRNFITPFGNSLLVLLTISWAAVAIYLSLKYSDWLFEQASARAVSSGDWAITWVLAACAFFAVAIGLWVFGKANPAAYLVVDIVSVLVLIAVPSLLLAAALKLGGVHQKGLGTFGMALIGIWHSILQIGAAVFLIKKGTWLTVLLSVILILIFFRIGRSLMRANQRAWLTIAWFIFGALMLILPPVVYDLLLKTAADLPGGLMNVISWPHTFDPQIPFSRFEWWSSWTGWWQMVPIFLGGVFGAFLSCVWLGWYFGVCLGFNGHNNESGGAARIEKFKQLIRFRLTKDTLTGYVIGVRDPQPCGKILHPQLIDVFQLTKRSGKSA